MNLANLIDPAWAQERFPRRGRPPPAVSAPEPDTDAAGRGARIGMRIRQALAGMAAPATVAQIAAVAKLSTFKVGTNLPHLLASREVERDGTRMHYRYWITQRGRDRR